jgi:iron complex transport system ATP-binding protein
MSLQTHNLLIDIPGRADGTPLNLHMQAGQVWGVLGPNGAGKTTLLHTLAGLRPSRGGDIHIHERSISSMARREIARELGIVFQERHDSFPATVLETALMESDSDRQQAMQALARLDADHLADRQLSTLSGGERQRVAIATLLTQSPQIWLADEPSNHLDMHHQISVMALLTGQAREGHTVVMCLHDLNLAARWCDYLLLLYPDGNACWGETRKMLSLDVLEHLYGQRLLSVELDGAPVFVPARS